ncbi:MAG: TrkA family potassium uptake protein [Caldisericales bacterium]|nr:TrkA family potassium uptake protein [Caldisericia bacterium]MCE5177437.1 TrkA family potassium uptake protein [bacterium]NMD14698.1 TrkA family potassium uptake protein [Caldisericales bacterium]
MNIIVIGCGRVGSALATILSVDGHNVSVIDEDESAFDKLPQSFCGKKVVGIGFDSQTLIEAGIEKTDAVAIVTPSDNTNIMVAETVKSVFGVKNVVARIYAPRKKRTYDRLNLRSVCPTTLGAYQIYAELLSSMVESKLPLNNGDFELLEIPASSVDEEETRSFEKESGSKIVGARTGTRVVFPWLGEKLDDVRSWIILAPTSHLRSIVDSIVGGV